MEIVAVDRRARAAAVGLGVGLLVMATAVPAAAKTDRVLLCHALGDGTHLLVEVSEKAEPAHRRHGDGAPGEPYPGDEDLARFSDDCDSEDVDTDGDRLTDRDELALETDRHDPDTDGDALIDGWEVDGHPNGTPLPGANPRRADIFIEMDYMVRSSATHGLGPNTAVLAGIEEVFADAPHANPDGSTGISIHLDLDDEVPLDTDLSPLTTEFDTIKSAYFAPERRSVYFYMLWGDGYDGGSSSGNAFAIPNADFLVTLGKWNAEDGGTDDQKIGTFVHELGHNLGLKHGGGDHTNYKPNYLSVMSYGFQVVGVPGPTGRLFDFQRFDLPTLNEYALDEANGFGAGPEWTGYSTFRYCPDTSLVEPVSLLDSVDWNCNGTIDSGMVSADVNRSNFKSTLSSHNDWANIVFDGGGVIGAGAGPRVRSEPDREEPEPAPKQELTFEEFERRGVSSLGR